MSSRLATIADIESMHRVRLAVSENRLRDPSRVLPEDYRRMLESDGRGWVYEVNGDVVGFGVADRVRRNIWALFVAPGYERRGIGRSLHDTMVEWLFRIAPDSIWLTTEPGTRAERFYAAAGWRRVQVERNGEVRFELTTVAPSNNALERTRDE
jgi:GNAT superfamily N-acetyltransferase